MRNLNSLTVPKKEGKSHSVEKSGKGTLLLWNGFLSDVRGFGCVENEVLSTYGINAHYICINAQKVDRSR